jgi:dynein heavy chain 1
MRFTCSLLTPSLGTAYVAAFRKLLLIKALRPDRVLPAAASFSNTVFSADLLAESGFELDKIVRDQVAAANPIAMCSIPGYDAAFKIENLVAASPGKTCVSVAMGSQEGYGLADQAISAAARVGNWVLLKNVHLAPSWLSQLEKRLQSMSAHPNFRLFLTLEINPSIPVNILRQSRIIMNEPPPGMRANLLESLQSITPERIGGPGPAERYRLYFGLAWLHAILVERLRYAPVGFTKTYEFNDSDQEAALSTIDSWMTQVAKGRSNLDPASIPFSALRSLLKQAIYGGYVNLSIL